MGNFANTLFSVLLGWVQGAAAWLWQLMGSEGAGGFMSWVLDNWLLLVILLCAGGVVIDLIVYLLRWQPYRVWRSFWQGINGPEEEPVMEDFANTGEARQWVYADGSTAMETGPAPEVNPAPIHQEQADMQLQSPVRPARRVIPARRRRAADGSEEFVLTDLGGTRQAYHQPYYPPQWHTGEQKTMNKGDDP